MTLDEFKNNAIEIAIFSGVTSEMPFSFMAFGPRRPGLPTISRRMIVILDHSSIVSKTPGDLWMYIDDKILYRMSITGSIESNDIEYDDLFTEMI